MTRPLSPAVIADKNALASANPFLTLVEIEVPTTPPTRYRLVRNTENVTWNGRTYYATNLSLSPAEEDGRASLTEQQLTVQNATREVGAIVESYDGLTDQPVTVYRVNKADLASGQPATKDEFRIIELHASESTLVARLGRANLWRASFPGKRQMRNACPFAYRGIECGYLGGLSTCDKTLTGPDGCEAHEGDSPLHPARFGGFALMPRPSGLGNPK